MTAQKIPTFEEAMKLIDINREAKLDEPQVVQKNKNPRKSRLEWNSNEISILFEKHQEMGNKWTTISQYLPSKTENIIKNFYYSSLRKLCRKIKKGILPKFGEPKCVLNLQQHLHLLDYIIEIFCPDAHSNKYTRKDSYLLEMLDTKQLTVEMVENYKNKLMLSAISPPPITAPRYEKSFIEKMPSLASFHKAIQRKYEEMQEHINSASFHPLSSFSLYKHPN